MGRVPIEEDLERRPIARVKGHDSLGILQLIHPAELYTGHVRLSLLAVSLLNRNHGRNYIESHAPGSARGTPWVALVACVTPARHSTAKAQRAGAIDSSLYTREVAILFSLLRDYSRHRSRGVDPAWATCGICVSGLLEPHIVTSYLTTPGPCYNSSTHVLVSDPCARLQRTGERNNHHMHPDHSIAQFTVTRRSTHSTTPAIQSQTYAAPPPAPRVCQTSPPQPEKGKLLNELLHHRRFNHAAPPPRAAPRPSRERGRTSGRSQNRTADPAW